MTIFFRTKLHKYSYITATF